MRHSSVLFVLAICVTLTNAFIARAQTALTHGNCNVTNQSVEIADGAVLNQTIDCVPKRAADAFRLRYVWLDEMSFSLLMSSTASEAMNALLGQNPLLVKNELYAELKEIWLRFAEPVSNLRHSGLSTQIFGQSGTKTLSDLYLGNLGETSTLPLRLLHNQRIIWPYGFHSQEVYNTYGFPSDMNMTYGADYVEYIENHIGGMKLRNDDYESISLSAISCVILYNFVSQEEFANYWRDARIAADMIENDPELSSYVLPSYSPSGAPAWVDNGGYASVAYLSRLNWPDDFLLRIGEPLLDDCAGVKEFTFAALPRKLFVKLAVIEFKNDNYDLRSLNYRIDKDYSIRNSPSYGEILEMGLGSLSPGRGRSVIVPLSIELRYALDEPPFRFIQPNTDSQRFAEALQASKFETFDIDGWFRKRKESFRPAQHKKITGTYLYGPAIEITTLNVGGERIDVRKAPAVAAVTNGYFEEGSCPFLYFVGLDGSISRHGRILVGANGYQNRRKVTIEIPPGTKYVLIQEEEPEISYLSKVNISRYVEGRMATIEEYVDIKLPPKHSITLSVPGAASNLLPSYASTNPERYWISVEGFYKIAPYSAD